MAEWQTRAFQRRMSNARESSSLSYSTIGPVSSTDRVAVFETDGCWFDSNTGCHKFAGIAQLEVRRTRNAQVIGSIPVASSICGYGGMADTLVLGTNARACRFKSCYPHHLERWQSGLMHPPRKRETGNRS